MLTKSSLVWGGALIVTATASVAQAGQLTVDLTLPQQNVAEYHKPYVAGWIEDGTGKVGQTLFVWYDVKKRDGGGEKYLKDLRTWWRKAGRDATMPIDGVSGATRAPGRQTLTLDTATMLKNLPAGQYSLVVEAAREAGGHDLVKVPVTWNPAQAAGGAGKGDGEIGDVKVAYKP